jgi:hypothetical protein
MTGVMAVAGQLGILTLSRPLTTRERRGVQQPPLVTPRGAGDRQGVQDAGRERGRTAQLAVIGRLAADVGEQVSEPVSDRRQPVAFGVITEQDEVTSEQHSRSARSGVTPCCAFWDCRSRLTARVLG